jgi:hypothetical protein
MPLPYSYIFLTFLYYHEKKNKSTAQSLDTVSVTDI